MRLEGDKRRKRGRQKGDKSEMSERPEGDDWEIRRSAFSWGCFLGVVVTLGTALGAGCGSGHVFLGFAMPGSICLDLPYLP